MNNQTNHPDKQGKTVKGRIRASVSLLAEILLTLILVLLCFAGFMSLLNIFFPTGTSFKDLIKYQKGLDSILHQEISTPREIRSGSSRVDDELMAAVLSESWNRVKSKRSSSIAWDNAEKGMELFDRDAVQTLKSSAARITFDDENYISMGSNSLIIIKSLENDPFFQEKRTFMVMMEGELSGRLSASMKNDIRMEITTPNAVTRIKSKKGSDSETEFKIMVDADRGSNVVVYSGTAQVFAQGKSVTVNANEGVRIMEGGDPHPVITLPDPPVPEFPVAGSSISYRNIPPRITFTWDTPENADEFRFQMDTNPDFKKPVIDEVLIEPLFNHGNLKKGTYYWRVSSLRNGCEGRTSEIQSFNTAKDDSPPALKVSFPQDTQSADFFVLSGATEPGASVFIGKERITVSETGTFTHELALRPGLNSVTVEAMDAAGNISYESKIIQRRK